MFTYMQHINNISVLQMRVFTPAYDVHGNLAEQFEYLRMYINAPIYGTPSTPAIRVLPRIEYSNILVILIYSYGSTVFVCHMGR